VFFGEIEAFVRVIAGFAATGLAARVARDLDSPSAWETVTANEAATNALKYPPRILKLMTHPLSKLHCYCR
jgi:hypothetical protein